MAPRRHRHHGHDLLGHPVHILDRFLTGKLSLDNLAEQADRTYPALPATVGVLLLPPSDESPWPLTESQQSLSQHFNVMFELLKTGNKTGTKFIP